MDTTLEPMSPAWQAAWSAHYRRLNHERVQAKVDALNRELAARPRPPHVAAQRRDVAARRLAMVMR